MGAGQSNYTNRPTNNGEPKRETEFDREAKSIMLSNEKLDKIVEEVKIKLLHVMRAAIPEDVGNNKIEPMTVTSLGAFIQGERYKIEKVCQSLISILSRLEI